MKTLLKVENLEVSFFQQKKEKKVVDRVNFEVQDGEILSIVGESGSGKSVTLLSVMGLLDDTGKVTGGEITFSDDNLQSMTEQELDNIRGNTMSMIFQDALTSLNPVFTVGNQITETMIRHLKLSKKEANDKAILLLEKVGLPNPSIIMKKYPHTLSGGMRQRVMIAMALCCNPKLLIADEPTTALDVTIQAQIMELLRHLQMELKMSVILITHDLGLVAEMADRVIVMYAGQIIEEAPVNNLFQEPAHPYTKALLKSIPAIKKDKTIALQSIEGSVPENYDTIAGCRFGNRCGYFDKECLKEQELLSLTEEHKVRCWKSNTFKSAI